MVRYLGFLVGLVFVFVLVVGALLPREASTPDPLQAIHIAPENVSWQQDDVFGLGILGTYDRAQLQRGYQVYKEVCAACHGMDLVHFRDLGKIGFSEAEVKALAKAADVPDIDPDTGEETTRPGLPSDHFPSPYPNDVAAAAANNNAAPPDLSLIVKARPGGTKYIYSLLTGYDRQIPLGLEVPDGLHFNPYFPSVNLAMPRPISDDQVDYADGTAATTEQMAMDVTAFLQWASEPELEIRRRAGVAVVAFLAILSFLAYLSYQRIWMRVKEHPEEVGRSI